MRIRPGGVPLPSCKEGVWEVLVLAELAGNPIQPEIHFRRWSVGMPC